MTISLKINGKSQVVDVDPSTPLLYVLRNDVGLHGPRFGCGLGQCGACTVHIDGRAGVSVLLPIAAVGDREDHDARRLLEDGKPNQAPTSLHRRAGRAMRLLHFRHGDARAALSARQPESDGR